MKMTLQKFKVLEEELNKKHNFNSKDLDVISSLKCQKDYKI